MSTSLISVGGTTLTPKLTIPGADATNTFGIIRGNSCADVSPSTVIIGSSNAPSMANTNNVIIGCGNCTQINSGTNNTVIGNASCTNLTSGSYNSAIGCNHDILTDNTHIACIGDHAQPNSGSATAGNECVTGSAYTVAIGSSTHIEVACTYLVCIGNGTLGDVGALYGVAIGYNAGSGLTNTVAIGKSAYTTASNVFIVGNNNLKLRLTTVGSTKVTLVTTFSGAHLMATSDINGGICVGTAGGSVNLTLPTATLIEGLNSGASVGTTLVFKMIVTDANTYTLTGNTGVTVVGKTALTGINSYMIYVRKATAGPTFIAYC